MNLKGDGIKVALVMDIPVYMHGAHSTDNPSLFYAAHKVPEKPTCKVEFETITTAHGDIWAPFLQNTRALKEGGFVTVLDLKRKEEGDKNKSTRAKKTAKK